MPKMTKHAKKRIKQRTGMSADIAKRDCRRAYRHGLSHSDTIGDLRGWMDKKFLCHKSANNMRIYKNHLYIFRYDTLVTMYRIPDNLSKNIEYFIEPCAYQIYSDYIASLKQRKTS